jgi:hypothetical protein
MSMINYASREINCNIVCYGTDLDGTGVFETLSCVSRLVVEERS